MDILDDFVTTYRKDSGRYRFLSLVRHQGTVVALALDDEQRFHYASLRRGRASDAPNGSSGEFYWDETPRELRFSREIRVVGHDGTLPASVPLVMLNGRQPPDPALVEEGDIDWFLSTTARLTADLPFQAFSDGKYIYLFRQSIAADHPRNFDVDDAPAVGSSLLVDRFGYMDGELLINLEVRYQRSGSKTVPASRTDTLGYEDMAGQRFHEPTHNLELVRHLVDGRFSVLLLPTVHPGLQRWQIFAYNGKSKAIDSFNIEQGADGLFDLKGKRYYTCPEHPADVLERQPGRCTLPHSPEGPRKLAALIGNRGFGEHCLRFSGHGGRMTVEMPAGPEATHELWFRTTQSKAILLCCGEHASAQMNRQIAIENGFLQAWLSTSNGNAEVIKFEGYAVNDGAWHQVSHVISAKGHSLYVDGIQGPQGTLKDADFLKLKYLYAGWGRIQGKEEYFHGDMDELRVWNRALSQDKLKESMMCRLVGNEPNLAAYWRFDEGKGTTAHDLTDENRTGFLDGAVSWIDSDAPIGDHPGIRRSSFRLQDSKVVVHGLSATQYALQERTSKGPLRRAIRVALAVGASIDEEAPAQVMMLDFGVSKAGRLALAQREILLENIGADLRMPLLSLDVEGLSVFGGRLEFASLGPAPSGRPLEGPLLLHSSTGDVHLYFRGNLADFRAAHYETLVERAVYVLNGEAGDLRFLARVPGPAMENAIVQVDPQDGDTCRVSFTSGGAQEIWESVPRDPAWFADVLNGVPHERFELIGHTKAALKGLVTLIPLGAGIQQPLHKDVRLRVGRNLVTLSKAASKGETELFILAVKLDEPAGVEVSLRIAYDYRKNTSSQRLRMGLPSACFLTDTSRLHGPVPTGKATLKPHKPIDGLRWLDGSSGKALVQTSKSGSQVGVLGQSAAGFSCRRDLTLESWIFIENAPSKSPARQRILHQADGARSYTLGLEPILSAYGFEGKDLLEIAGTSGLNPGEFTVAFWVDPGSITGAAVDCPLSFRTDAGGFRGFSFMRHRVAGKDQWEIGISGPNGAVSLPGPKHSSGWTHIAAVYSAEKLRLFVDGIHDEKPVQYVKPDQPVSLRLGGIKDIASFNFTGHVAEICMWNRALDAETMKALNRRRLNAAEMADPGLLFCLRVEDGAFRDFSSHARPKTPVVTARTAQSPLPEFLPFFGVNQSAGRSAGTVQAGEWFHLAASYRAAFALQLSGKVPGQGQEEYVDCGNGVRLAVHDKFTVDAAWICNDLTTDRPLFCQGDHRLYAQQATGHLVYELRDMQDSRHVIKSAHAIKPGKLSQVAVSWTLVPDGAAGFVLKVLFFVSGENKPDAQEIKLTAAPKEAGGSFLIGKAERRSGNHLYLNGTIAELKVWSRAFTYGDFTASFQEGFSRRDLLHLWAFAEGEGNSIRDEAGNQHATRHGGCWVERQDAPLSRLKILVNGRSQPLTAMAPAGSYSPQMTLGGIWSAGSYIERLDGKLDEIRIWKVVRSPSEIAENMFRPLNDEREHLIACFDCEDRSFGRLDDRSGYGHHLWPLRAANVVEILPGGQVNIPATHHLVDSKGTFTFEIWVMAQIPGSILSAGQQVSISWQSDDRLVAMVSKGAEKAEITTPKLNKGQWYHVALAVSKGTMSLYLDGTAVPRPKSFHFGFEQVGSWFLGGLQPGFGGILRDLRFWQRFRTAKDVKKDMHRQLSGSETDLKGYWPMSSLQEGKLLDLTSSGKHGACTGQVKLIPFWIAREGEPVSYQPSAAPVGRETPKVRTVPSQVSTGLAETIEGRPAVAEWGWIQGQGPDLTGTVRRCYAYLRDGAWNLLLDYKVGAVVAEYIGQALSEPTILGFIEGAPPVPAENFGPNDTAEDASSVELTDVDGETRMFTSGGGGGLDANLALRFGAGLYADLYADVAPFGIGGSSLVAYLNVLTRGGMFFEASSDWMWDTQVSFGRKSTRTDRVELVGAWDENAKRFVAENWGFAFVTAESIDIYVLNLKGADAESRGQVAWIAQPSPTKESDRGIIPFKINPKYIKQGTLDGKFRTEWDTAYQGSSSTSNLSYFKVKEAQDLKESIKKERERLEAYYQGFRVRADNWEGRLGLGAGIAGGLTALAIVQPVALAAALAGASLGGAALAPVLAAASLGGAIANIVNVGTSYGEQSSLPDEAIWNRSLVNTYFWTEQGGLFAEAEEVSIARQEAKSGESFMRWGVQGDLSTEFILAGLQLTTELESLAGGHARRTSSASHQKEDTYSLGVSLSLRRGSGLGRVDAYRFLTFYLEPSEESFNDLKSKVVDQAWLSGGDPNARYLAAALQSRAKTLPWRVMHRVTFVSRSLASSLPGLSKLEEAILKLNIGSTYELARRIEPFVRPLASEPAKLAQGVRREVRKIFPTLTPFTEEIVDLMRSYLGIHE